MRGTLYAKYVGFQCDGDGGGFDLFNVVDETEQHERHGSTVALETLKKLGIERIVDKQGKPWYAQSKQTTEVK